MVRGLPRWYVALLALAAAIFVAEVAAYWGYLLDDSFISFRYARNLVAGAGLVFNPGERVEGYTNFLFVVLSAALLWLGLDPVAGTRALGVAAAVATLVLVVRLERRVDGERAGPPLAPLLLLVEPAFAYWSVVSFETIFFTAFLAAAVDALLGEEARGRTGGAALVFVGLALWRPEGVLAFALAASAALGTEAWRSGGRPRWGRHVARAAVFAALYGVYFALRWAYYGHPLPNTFTAKVTGGPGQWLTGLGYLGAWAIACPLFALAPLAAFSGSARPDDAVARVVVATVVLGLVTYVAGVGGDAMPFFRFFVPLMPLAAVLAGWTLGARRGRAALVVAACVASAVLGRLDDEPERAFVAHRTTLVGGRVGEWFAGQLAADDWLAVNTAGSLPYHAGRPTIDMLGLTDEAIARRPVFIVSPGWAGHRRGWGAYVLDRRPRVILWYNSAGAVDPFYLGDRELADDPFFRFFYQRRRVTLPAGEGDVVARFVGRPFGSGPLGSDASLGIRAEVVPGPVAVTVVHEAPVEVNYFLRDPRDDALWALRAAHRDAPAAFVDAVAAAWSAMPPPPGAGGPARAEVEALCAEARRLVAAGDYARAKAVLADAVERNAGVGLPLVYQYVANVAALTSDLLAGVAAEKEALRLEPDNPLYRDNLKHLLRVPFGAHSRPAE